MASPASAESKGDAHWNFEDAANKEFAHIRPAETVNLKADVLEIAPAAEKKGGLDAQNREKWLEHAKKNPDMVLGQASWYGRDFDRKATASGLPYDMYTFTAAHRTLPLGTVVRVTDQFNGRSVMVCVTDRGPYAKGRILDLSYAAA
ncbi:MAG: septal ring lytic transglycosylase RlpA family protein, partial [Desulfovibrio sp.]|nr:septal ring lytic transglycosylase RlpA family protein [Desulfovibrio sp.]